MKLLALLTNKKYWRLHSILVKFILCFYRVQIGSGFYIEGTPRLKIRGKGLNIRIGDNVSIFGDIDLRNRENGKIIICDRVCIDNDVRIVSAREGVIYIGENTSIGPFTIINGGGNVTVGKNVLFAKNVSINANDHKSARGLSISRQGFTYGDIIIEDDVWLGSNVCVNKGVTIREGSIVGANAVVTRDTEPYSINVGVPARRIGERG